MHISRLAEEIVLWNSAEFGFVRIPDSFATGSSLMPQKKNPDVAEIARGKAGRTAGNFIALLTVMKGLPLSYNRDMQEDKEPLFDTADAVGRTLAVMTALVSSISFDEQRMRAAVREGFMTATDLADDLVEKGVPFRTAHEVVGGIVRECQERGRTLDQLTLADLRRHEPAFDRKSLKRVDPSIRSAGGRAPEERRHPPSRPRSSSGSGVWPRTDDNAAPSQRRQTPDPIISSPLAGRMKVGGDRRALLLLTPHPSPPLKGRGTTTSLLTATIVLLLGAASLSCGKKGPPSFPARSFPRL